MKMNMWLLSLLSAAALVGSGAASADDRSLLPARTPEASPPLLSGYLSLYGGENTTTWNLFTWGRSDTLSVYGGDGRMNIWLAPNSSIQIDLEAERSSGFGFPELLSIEPRGRLSALFGAHLTYRQPDAFAAGLLAAVVSANNVLEYDDELRKSTRYGLVGVEGQAYPGNGTLYPQIGYLFRMSGPEEGGFAYTPDNAWFARLGGRYFVTPNDRIAAEIGYADVNHDTRGFNFDTTIVNWGVSYEHRFMHSPWGLFVEYAGFRNRIDNPNLEFQNNVTEHIFLAGVRLHLGQDTLLSQERTGAAFDMPKFIRALPWHEGVRLQN